MPEGAWADTKLTPLTSTVVKSSCHFQDQHVTTDYTSRRFLVPVQREIRRGNACAALSDEDFDKLVEIARMEVGSSSLLVATTAKVGEWVSGKIPDFITNAIESALSPIIIQTSRVVGKTHFSDDNETWLAWIASRFSGEWFHKGAAVVSGVIGGSGSALTAVAEVGVSTALIIRSIQDVARGYGADLSDPLTIVECLAVLGKGGPSSDDDALDDSYWAMRAGLKSAVTSEAINKALSSETAKQIFAHDSVQKAMASKTVESILSSNTYKKIIEKYGITTQAAFAEKSVPILGAALGAVVNYQFVSYYQAMTHVVFKLKEVSAAYEENEVDACYQRVLSAVKKGVKTFSKEAGK